MTTTESQSRPSRGVSSAMKRYRVAAWITGVVLLVLVLVAMPLKYLADEPLMVAVVGTLHGWLYLGYLVITADLTYRARWPIGRAVLIALAGTVPFCSFIAERKVTRPLRESDEG